MDSGFNKFTEELKKDIQDFTKAYGHFAGWVFWIKATALLFSWGFLYVYLVFYCYPNTITYLLSLLWGLLSLLIIFNIGHDAVHGVVSKSMRINNTLKYSFNLVGGNAYSWKLKHNIAHHLYTNIEGMDFDTDFGPLMRVSPKTEFRKQYRWQHFTFLIIYPLLSLLIIFVADFKIFYQTKKTQQVKSHPSGEWVILIISKLFYVSLIFVVPLIYSPYSFQQILIVFISFHLINGIVIACVFMPSHYFPGSIYFQNKEEDFNWYEHQLSTTMNLSPKSRIITSILGGLNLNVAHHLFPNMCHTHYYKLSGVIKKRAQLHGIVLHELPYFKALIEHVKFLKILSSEDA